MEITNLEMLEKIESIDETDAFVFSFKSKSGLPVNLKYNVERRRVGPIENEGFYAYYTLINKTLSDDIIFHCMGDTKIKHSLAEKILVNEKEAERTIMRSSIFPIFKSKRLLRQYIIEIYKLIEKSPTEGLSILKEEMITNRFELLDFGK